MSTNPEIRKAYKVHGRVQGVGFRWWAQRQAHQLGLRGRVRNCADGSVEIAIAGPESAVQEMCVRLKSGPRGAHVHHLEELPPPPGNLPNDFQISL
jgi:acylphosphatase